MSADKQSTVKSELSPDGGLKLTIKREKPIEEACKSQWVTEARGSGLGKLVIKRKSPGAPSQSPETTSLHADRQTEQRPVLRLSITCSSSSNGKNWSLCEVPPVVEDVASASELSPNCQLQQSPKDSGIDMSSPPHDDGAVGVEPNPATGIWTATDSHTGDSSAVEAEKMTSNLEKLESTVASLVYANSAVLSSSKSLWPDTASCSSEGNQPKVQSTLRSRGERSPLKSPTSSSQKLVNPLAKPHSVGRYQHMLPVNRIRAESNIARRSSLEESPTYNMVTSRTSLFSRVPRVKTKLKLLSNNTYAPVFDQEMERNEQHEVTLPSKCLNVKKSSSAVAECKRNRLSCRSSATDAFANMKVKLHFPDKSHGRSRGEDKIQKLPKLKLIVKSDPALSVSCIEQPLEDASITSAVKQADENIRHVRQKQRKRETEKQKATVASDTTSTDSSQAIDSFCANHLPSIKATATGSCHPKRKSPKGNQDCEPSIKKSKLQDSKEQLAGRSLELCNTQQLSEEVNVNNTDTVTVQAVHCKPSADEAVCTMEMSLSSTDRDVLSAGQSSVCVASDKVHTAVPDEAEKSDSISVAQTESSEELICTGGTVEIHRDRHCSEASNSDSEKCTMLNFLNADDDKSRVDRPHEGQLSSLDDCVGVVNKETVTAVQSDSTSDCGTAPAEEALVADEPCVTISGAHADSMPDKDMPSDQSLQNDHTCGVFDENTTSVTAEQPVAECTDIVVPLSSPVLVSDDSVMRNMNCSNSDSTLLLDSTGDDGNKPQNSNLSLTLKPAVVSEHTSSSVAPCIQNNSNVVKDHHPVDTVRQGIQDTDCLHEARQETVDSKELCKKNCQLKSVCRMSDQDHKPGNECDQKDSHRAYFFDVPSHVMPLSAPCHSKEHKETTVANSACANGFLAAFTQFVKKATVKKKSATCKVIETDSTLKSAKEMLSKPSGSQKCVRRRPFTSQRRRHTCSENQTSQENRLPDDIAHCQSINTVSSHVASLPETRSSEDIDSSKSLTCTAVDDEHPVLCREELQNVVSAHRQLVTLRLRVCELLETALPELRFPFGFQRDSAAVERFVKNVTDVLSSTEADVPDIQQCSDPVVTLHHMPDRSLQSLQQQVIRLLTLLLPDTSLSDISGDSLEVFLELMTSYNQPLPGAFCVSQPDLHLSQKTNPQPQLQLQSQPSSLYHADTDINCEQVDISVVRTDSHMPAVDTLFNMPSSLNTSGPVSDKRSIRRQVKDCLMFLDRDLT